VKNPFERFKLFLTIINRKKVCGLFRRGKNRKRYFYGMFIDIFKTELTILPNSYESVRIPYQHWIRNLAIMTFLDIDIHNLYLQQFGTMYPRFIKCGNNYEDKTAFPNFKKKR
jgi:hypothetical protein